MQTKNLENEQAGSLHPPAHLSAASKALWSVLVPRRARTAERLTLLAHALEARDRAESARIQLAEVGLLVKNPAGLVPHAHPLVKVESEARKEFTKTRLALSLESALPDRMQGSAWEDQPGIGLPAPPGVTADATP